MFLDHISVFSCTLYPITSPFFDCSPCLATARWNQASPAETGFHKIHRPWSIASGAVPCLTPATGQIHSFTLQTKTDLSSGKLGDFTWMFEREDESPNIETSVDLGFTAVQPPHIGYPL